MSVGETDAALEMAIQCDCRLWWLTSTAHTGLGFVKPAGVPGDDNSC